MYMKVKSHDDSLRIIGVLSRDAIGWLTSLHIWRIMRDLKYCGTEFIETLWHFCLLFSRKSHVVVERQGLVYATYSITFLLMTWRRKEPGHQQLWY